MSLLLKIVGSVGLFCFFASVANAAETALVVLEPIFEIFRSDWTAIIVTFGLPAIAIVVVLDFRYRVFHPLKNDIDFANQVFSRASDPQSYAEINAEVDQKLSENRFLEPIWLEYRETMSQGRSVTDEVIYQNTKRPKDYFTAEAISRQRGSMQDLDYLPNIFVGVGLLVTFLGLTAAVYETAAAISKAGSDIDGVLGSVRNLLTVASIKFLTSVAGILCSIGLTFSIKSMQSNINGRLNQLHDRIEKCLEFLSIEHLQLRTISAIEGMSSSISKGISQGVAEGVQEIAGNELRLFAEEMRAISVTLKSAGKDIETFGENYSQQIKQIDAAFEERLEKAGQPLDDWVEKLQVGLKLSSEALDENLKSFSKQIQEASQVNFDNNQEAYTGIQKSIESVTVSFEAAASKLTEKLSEQLNLSEKYQSSFQEMVVSLTTNSQNFAQLNDNLVSSIESNRVTTEGSLEKFNESIAGLKVIFDKQKDDLQNIVNSVSEIKIQSQTAHLDKEQEIGRLITKLAEITTKLESNLSDTQSQLTQAFEPLVKELATLTSKIEKSGAGSESGVFSKFFRG